jgi:uncharacterized protein (TIGR02646 family)
MIRVAREAVVPGPLDLTDPGSSASLELQAARTHFATSNERLPAKFFKAYGDREVRKRLKDMFHGKCAYCESSIAESQDSDVEHYRPKGQVLEANGAHPGYWWLAMDWTNLVLSCQHCNQRRAHIIIDPGMTEEQVQDRIDRWQTQTRGKLDSFPTEDGIWVSRPEDAVTSERPLLIDPTRVDPELHITWVLNEPFVSVTHRNRIGKTSIDIYALNRRYLVERRTVHLRELRRRGDRIIAKLNEAVNQSDDAVAASMRASALEQVQDLRGMCKQDQPYAGLARAYLKELVGIIRGMR